ncbi:PAS domain-containing protein [Streptomyces avicenniae]|uniref:PAS domain-containing protein n=1 Tax=Streptomyces avicenniae TaxID=500153 RepID=UPI00069CBCEA|nr:PAS domain-containing protein [Streptomyces avicenniae]
MTTPSGVSHAQQGFGPPGDASSAAHGAAPLLPALLDGLDSALFALDITGRVTHWNRQAERLLGWSRDQAVGRAGLGGWAVRACDEADVHGRLAAAARQPGVRIAQELPLLRQDGARLLVHGAAVAWTDADGRPAGVYCAFGEARARLAGQRDLALAAALLGASPWAVLVLDPDLRTVSVNARACATLNLPAAELLGEPLAESFRGGLDELESALEHTLAGQAPDGPVDLWLTPRDAAEDAFADPVHAAATGLGGPSRRCLQSGFLRLTGREGDGAAPLGVAWLFEDVTRPRLAAQEAARRRFRDSQLARATRAAAECEDPMEAAALHLHFALTGFAEHALLDVRVPATGVLVRTAESPGAFGAPASATRGVPVRYRAGHPAPQALETGVPVRATGGVGRSGWAADHRWPKDAEHALCVVLRSGGRSLGVLTFLRGAARRPFDRDDVAFGEDVALRVAAAVDLALRTPRT